jgi:hypothetical protein
LVPVVLAVFGACACARKHHEREAPGEARTRSAELTPLSASDGGAKEETAAETEGASVEAGPRAGAEARDARAAVDPRFDAGRLSIVGSADDRDRNLGVVGDGGAAPIDTTVPPPQRGAGAAPPPPPPREREGAGRPGGGGDPFY